jgi:hypothetical protein
VFEGFKCCEIGVIRAVDFERSVCI